MNKRDDFVVASQTFIRTPGMSIFKPRRQDMKNDNGEQMGELAFSPAGKDHYTLYFSMPASGWLKLRDKIDLMLCERRFAADVEREMAIKALDKMKEDAGRRERELLREVSQQALEELLAMPVDERNSHPELLKKISCAGESYENR
jgi:hypothetical protein